MEFKKYSSLENHYQAKAINGIQLMGLAKPDVLWTLREKIHGANYSVWYNGLDVKFAKRTSFVGEMDNFFGHHDVTPVLKVKIVAMYDNMVDCGFINDGAELIVYGELAGTMASGRKVQVEVDYGKLDFYAFDIKVNGSYISDDSIEKMCGLADITTAPLIATGSFYDLFETRNDFQSVVEQQQAGANQFNLIFEGDNVSEGYVLKPNHTHYFDNGSRVAIKSKNEKFSEKKKKSKVQKMATSKVEMSSYDQKVIDCLDEYITAPRLRNVISKHGDVTQKQFGVILNMLVADVIEDYSKDVLTDENYAVTAFDSCNDEHQVRRLLSGMCSKFIGMHFGSIVSGTF